jgi:hypothetical protein
MGCILLPKIENGSDLCFIRAIVSCRTRMILVLRAILSAYLCNICVTLVIMHRDSMHKDHTYVPLLELQEGNRLLEEVLVYYCAIRE